MSNPKLKPYAVKLTVRPKADKLSKYAAKTYNGIAMGKSPNDAKEQAIQVILISFKDNDGSINKPVINRETITVKSCKLYDDFFTVPENSTKDGSNN